ncbi:MAG: leucine-rich repeat protein [Bacteroidaceae bacterium]|nr:leucine-rich repeat protein [Bacteroidaceae bacterium]
MKRTLSFLTLAMCATMGAWAQVKIGNIYYNLDEDTKTAEVTNPRSAHDYTTTYSGDIVIPASVVNDGKEYRVTSIGAKTFANAGLTSIVIPNSVEIIGEEAFNNNFNLPTIEIPNSVKIIGDYAFFGCQALTSMVIPNRVDSIGNSIFYYCNNMTSVKFGTGLTKIGRTIFLNCPRMKTIEVDKDNAVFDSRNNCNAIIETATDKLITGCQSTVIPNDVKIIGQYAFYECEGFTGVEFPDGLEAIEKGAFYNCQGLTAIMIPASVTSIEAEAFSFCHCLASVKVNPSNTVYDSRENCNAIIEAATSELILGCKNTVIPSGIQSIGECAFEGCRDMIEIEIPNSVTRIGRLAFNCCHSLSSVTIPDGVATIELASFQGCSKLKEIHIPNSVTRIEGCAFNDCSSIKSIEIPNSVKSIDRQAFSSCKGLLSVTLPEGLACISDGTFSFCSNLASIEIPSSVTTIGETAFEYCQSLVSVTIPANVKNIGDKSFYYCLALTSLYLLPQVPPTSSNWVADSQVYESCTLYVPKGSEEAYAAAEGWKDFKNIVAMTDENTGDDNTEKGIAIDATNFPDEFFRGWLLSQTYGKDGVLTDKEIAMVTEMDMSNKKIHNLEGIGYFTELKTLTCDDCNMSQLDLSHCPKLESLSCSDNKLTELDLSSCPSLTMLQCPQNQLTSINLSGCSELQFLQCHGNQLTAIDLSDCKGLIDIDCGSNLLTAIDLSPCTKLKVIRCVRNQLTAIDVSACKDLISIDCQENKLTTLDCSGLTELNGLLCGMNALTSINISGCSKLQHLLCEFNYLDINAFQHIVNNIPEYDEGDEAFMLIYSESPAEGIHDYTPDHNICSKEQVTIAKAKGWQVLCYTIDNCQPYEGVDVTPATDYLPFVEEGKVWHTFASSLHQKGNKVNYYFSGEEIKGGKTYSVMYGQKEKETPYRIGLYREENKKVYEYNEESGTEYVIYDFSLKVGDEFTSTIPFVRRFRVESEGEKVVNGYHLRTLRLVSEDPDYNHGLYWIEGLGGEDGPFGGLDSERPGSQRVDIAYVQYINSNFTYLPFYFFDINHEWHGAPALLGEKNNEAYEEVGLKYEIIGSRLHVYGYIWASPGSSNYLFIKEEETDDPKSLLLRVEREYTNAVLTANMGVYYIDLYSSEYGMYYNYKVVDEFGEHDVVNRNYEYRPFVEDGKAWKVGALNSGNPVQFVEYYYFDGDTIINGKTCKQMMCQLYVCTDFPEYNYYSQHPSRSYVGAWYEENQKVYFCNATNNQFKLMYDFSIDENDILQIDNHRYVIEHKQIGGINGFKGVYRKVRLWEDGESIYSVPWLEGVGGTDRPTTNVYPGYVDPAWFLMSCTVGDEVIYCNSEVDDPFNMGAKKRRFDFNHTIKTQPKTPRRAGELDGLYGEYNDLLLDVNLNPLDEAYLVRITDKSGKTVYEKAINAGSIVGLNIDISAYPEGQYTVTIENSKETFTGEFEINTTGIEETPSDSPSMGRGIYNLQGQRISVPQKGINIINGKKIIVK